MIRSIVAALALTAMQAQAQELVCFTVSSITLSNMGQEIEHEVTSPDDLSNPEFYTVFDLATETTTLFWVAPDGSKMREVSSLRMINKSLYVGEYDAGSETIYSTYHFQEDFKGGLLVEANFVASFRCEEIAMNAAEEKYSILFSEFEVADP